MRRLNRVIRGAVAALWVLGGLLPPATASELDKAEFDRLQQELQPGPEEAWRTIPWKISLIDAQQSAVKQQKPIFIWAMDGHPLGCT